MTRAQFYSLVCRFVAPGKLLPSPKEAVAEPLPKHWLLGAGVNLGHAT